MMPAPKALREPFGPSAVGRGRFGSPSALPWRSHVSCGSKADVTLLNFDVRFTRKRTLEREDVSR